MKSHYSKLFVVAIFAIFGVLASLYDSGRPVSAREGATGNLRTPMGVSATSNLYANKVGIYWDAVREATQYRLFRSLTNDISSATDIGSTQANYFFDSTAVAGQTYFYWIRAENSGSNSEISATATGQRAVGNNSPGPPFPPLAPPPVPVGNQITAAKAYLGKTLFWDEQLSSTKTVSCGTCHRPADGGADPRSFAETRNPGFDNVFGTADDVFGSPGVPETEGDGSYTLTQFFGMQAQVTNRRSPSYLNAGYTTDGLFWDGRATDQFRDPITNSILLSSFGGLESQSVFPPLSPIEMGHAGRDWTDAVSRISVSKPLALAINIPSSLNNWIDGRTYPELFEEGFGSNDITPARIAMAIATHERTLFSDQTPLDRAASAIEPLTQQEENGRAIFVNQNCIFCHGGALLSNSTYQNVGVRPTTEDRGRGGITNIADDNGRFKTPSLRNLDIRAPYMHNGRFATIEEVVEFYNRGGDFPAPNVDPRVRPLGLTVQQRAALSAFLKRPLTDPRVANELPPFDRPTLYTETDRVPTVTGAGRSGTNGVEPNAIAIEPPILGNTSFAIAVADGLAGAQAFLVVGSTDPGVGAAIPATGSFVRVQTTLGGSGSNGYGTAVLSIPASPAVAGRTFFGRWYINDAAAANGFSVSKLITFTVFGDWVNRSPFDFDGDGKTDISIARQTGTLEWWINNSSNSSTTAFSFGLPTDIISPADFTGDGKTDIAMFRPSDGFWYVLRSEDSSFFGFPLGSNGDIPVPADFDADGKADPALFRPSQGLWFVQRSSDQQITTTQFGVSGDKPVVGDYDGDRRADIAIYRPSNGSWWIERTTAGSVVAQFGTGTDTPVAADFTGDGKTDIAVWRPGDGFWYVMRSEDSSFYAFPFGSNGDVPAPGDYDGDGKADPAVFRPSLATWFIQRSTSGIRISNFGLTGDRPLPNAFIQ